MSIRASDENGIIADKQIMIDIGNIIKMHRKDMVDIKPYTREGFINYAAEAGLWQSWISEKSLANIENGLNMPTLKTLYNLAIGFQIDPRDLFREISDILSRHRSEK